MKPLKNSEIDDLIGVNKSKFLIAQYLESRGRVYLVDSANRNKIVARITRRIFAAYNTEFLDRPALNLQYFKFV